MTKTNWMGSTSGNDKANSEQQQVLGCFGMLLGTIRDAAALLDAAGRVLDVNQQFESLTGHKRDQLIGQNFRLWCRTYSPDASDERTSSERKLLGAAPYQGKVQLRTAGREELIVGAQVSPTEVDSFRGFIFVAWPAADERADNTEKTFQQTRLESLGVLSSSIVHDLNNILTGILGHVSFLRLSLEEMAGDKDSLFAIEDGARKAATLTHQILEFARGEELELTPVDLPQIVKDCMNLVRASVPQNVALEYSAPEESAYVSGNEGQLHQLVLNLTVNARDALPKGGRIAVQVGNTWYHDVAFCRAEGIQPGEYVTLAVSDNGVGIPDDVRSKIFEPFFTTKLGRGGTGLGLATVQAIVKAHRGLLVVESSPGQGTTFRVSLPQTSPRVDRDTEKVAVALPTGSERILVVDDEDAVRTIMQRSLEHLGYEVSTATDGSDALEAYLDDELGFDLIIVDMIMPRMSGDELFYRLKDVDPGVPILVASGYASDNRTKAILRDGALGFIQKPFAIEELAQMVRGCLDRSQKSTSEEAAA